MPAPRRRSIDALEQEGAAIGVVEPEQQASECRLARAAGSHQSERFAGMDRQRHTVHGFGNACPAKQAAARTEADADLTCLGDALLARGACAGAALRNGIDQCAGVAVTRVGHDIGDRTLIDNSALMHDDSALGEMGDQRKVVRNEQQRRTLLARQPRQQVQHVELHQRVERRRGLVGDDQFWLAKQRDRDADALAHAAGELMWVGTQARSRIGNCNLRQRVLGAPHRLPGADRAMGAEHLHHLIADAHHRVQRGRRVLEIIAISAPRSLRHRLDVKGVDPPARKRDAASAARGGRIQQIEDGKPGRALAGPGLADQAERFARLDLERDAIDRPHRAGARAERHRQLIDLEHGFGHPRPRSDGRSTSRTRSDTIVMLTTSSSSAMPGKTVIQ